jgi:hypothetical protein
VSPDLFGTAGGSMDGGRSRDRRSRPGKTSDGVEKNCAKPSEKKLGLSPGEENRSRGI